MRNIRRTYTAEDSGAFVELFKMEPYGSGLLDRLQFAVKDLIDIRGFKTACGNADWGKTHPVAPANALCVDQLLAAGAKCLGKTVSDELAAGLVGKNFFLGTPLNPAAPDRVPGGSSSGSASAVACGLVDFALGTDTGGSVRIPANNCGIWGYRPSHGAVSVAGVNPLAPSFDTVGVLAMASDVLLRAASVLLGQTFAPGKGEVGTVYVLKDAFDISDLDVREAVTAFLPLVQERCGGKTQEVSLRQIDGIVGDMGFQHWHETFCTIQWAEIWSCLGPWIERTNPKLGPGPKKTLELAKNVEREQLGRAVNQRTRLYESLRNFLTPSDLICMPTAPSLAPRKGSIGVDRTKGDYYPRTLSLTSVAGIGRLPQVTLPLGMVKGVPAGISLLASHGRDSFLLAAVGALDGEPSGESTIGSPSCPKSRTLLKSLAFLDGLLDPLRYENSTRDRDIGRSESVRFRIRAKKDVPASVGHASTAGRLQTGREEANNQRAGSDLLDDPFPDLVGVENKVGFRQAGDGAQMEPASVQGLLEETVSTEDEDRQAQNHAGAH